MARQRCGRRRGVFPEIREICIFGREKIGLVDASEGRRRLDVVEGTLGCPRTKFGANPFGRLSAVARQSRRCDVTRN